jgi:hypothetical protein
MSEQGYIQSAGQKVYSNGPANPPQPTTVLHKACAEMEQLEARLRQISAAIHRLADMTMGEVPPSKGDTARISPVNVLGHISLAHELVTEIDQALSRFV